MRLYGVTLADVETIIARPEDAQTDDDGNLLFIAEVGGRRVRIVVASDDPAFVITVHERRR